MGRRYSCDVCHIDFDKENMGPGLDVENAKFNYRDANNEVQEICGSCTQRADAAIIIVHDEMREKIRAAMKALYRKHNRTDLG